MSSRSGTSSGDPATRLRGADPAKAAWAADTSGPRNRLVAAAGVAGVGAVLTALAPLVGLVSPHTPPAFPSWPLLLVLAAVPPVLAVLFVRRERPVAAAAVLLGPAALAPGRAIIDAQLLVDAGMTVRPELLLPTDLDPLTPSIGVWLLLAAHAANVFAGVLAAGGNGVGARDGPPHEGGPGGERPSGASRKQALLGAALFAAALGAAGALMAKFTSEDPYLLPGAALDSPVLVLLGSVVVALSLTGVAGFVVSSSDPEAARGGLLGLAAATAAPSLTAVLSAVITPRLAPGWGSVVGLLAAGALAALAVPAGRHERPRPADELRLPALTRLLTGAGVSSIAAGASAIAGFLMPKLHMPAGVSDFTPYSARTLLPAGIVLVVLGCALLTRTWAARVRPALGGAWAVVPLAGAATLDTVLTAAQAAGARIGIGTWATVVAVVLAGLAAVVGAVAGAVERDDVDLTELSARRAVLVPAVLSGVFGLGAFTFPVLVGPDYTAPGVFTDFDTTSWGLVAALLSVLAAAALAPVCRGSRTIALLGGAASVVGVRLLELPLTGDRVPGMGPGAGLWFGLACLAALGVTALLARPRKD